MNRSKLYTKRDAVREGKLYFIFCEGEVRETTYFHFFNKIASQVIIQIVPVGDGRNSPMGLYRNARQLLTPANENHRPEYELATIDEVWFVIDTDEWGNEIDALRKSVALHNNWFVAQSNPSFEVWLYHHFSREKPNEKITNWKGFLNTVVTGGFDNRKHPKHIQAAISNARASYSESNGKPDINTTNVFALGERIVPLVKKILDEWLGASQ